MWKPGQLVTIDNKIYRVTKAGMHQGTPSICAQCRTANAHFRRHDEDLDCLSWKLKWECIAHVPFNCFLKPIN